MTNKNNQNDKSNENNQSSFSALGIDPSILSAVAELGYETATPIQAQGIPVLLHGDDLLAQAQTGTGKTATFALPILSCIDKSIRSPQALVLVPTRELAIQVAEAFHSYAKHVSGFIVTPIYGGQDFRVQLRLIKRGAQVIVGTPGRLMDHLRRGTLSLDSIKTVVLDEADEMLKMGFADDVEWILSQHSQPHQTALFSATMPSSIQKIAQRYLKPDAKKIQIQSQSNTVDAITQSYVTVMNRDQKLAVLTRFLEAEDNEAVIIFTRTKTESLELAEKLQARGYNAAALNGDMSQSSREKTIARLRSGELDMVIATDVAARGIDVERVTHVINYDIPHDVDAYVHRIGRTGRAGREGNAILFVTPREIRLLKDIERHIRRTINRIDPPSLKTIQAKRLSQLSDRVTAAIQNPKNSLSVYIDQVENLIQTHELSPTKIAAALLMLGDQRNNQDAHIDPVVIDEKKKQDREGGRRERHGRRDRFDRSNRSDRSDRREGNEKRHKKNWNDRSESWGSKEKKDRNDRNDRSDRRKDSWDNDKDKKERNDRKDRKDKSGQRDFQSFQPKFEKKRRYGKRKNQS